MTQSPVFFSPSPQFPCTRHMGWEGQECVWQEGAARGGRERSSGVDNLPGLNGKIHFVF